MCVGALPSCRGAWDAGPGFPSLIGVCVGTSQALLVAVTSIFSPMLDSEH